MNEEEKILRRIPAEIILLSLLLALLSLIFFYPLTSLFVFAGGVFSALSFIWLKKSLLKFLVPDKKKALKSALAFYTLRLLLILVIFSIIIFFFSQQILAFVAGFSTLILITGVESGLALVNIKKWKS
ncbi:MAG: ATP synthase subunit I [Candidatus Aminicenantes bacterium]